MDVSGKSGRVAGTAVPNNYFPYNSELTNALPLQLDGILGQGIVVGIIDSGVSSVSAAVGDRVIGGENFVPGAGEPDANSPSNDSHGTFVACMVGANAAFLFDPDDPLVAAVETYCTPPSIAPCTFPGPGSLVAIPMVGQAPSAQFFAFKVFPANGGGAPESRILQAMDRAIDLKKTTLPSMRVVNMSIGGTTLFAGRDIEDELATSMASAGITLVTSAGNAGPSGSTGGSPGTARNILTVGAASSPVNERILWDFVFGHGFGALFRPDYHQQVTYFSSRGPTADGRPDPEVVANGDWSFVESADGTQLFFASGTSFASPTVAGVAALLASAKPNATPAKIRAAIIRGANDQVIPTARREDQGAGYVDAAAAKQLLDHGVLPAIDFGPGTESVALNVLLGARIVPIVTPQFSTRLASLRPTERRDFYYFVDKETSSVRLTLTNITPALPPDEQNQLFGDDVLFAVHSAKTSQINGEGDYVVPVSFLGSDRTFLLEDLDTGLLRVTVTGDWTNVGTVSTDLTIERDRAPLSKRDFKGKISEGEETSHQITIAPGTASVRFQLSWETDWAAYPTDDLDMVLLEPDGSTLHFDGATLNSPERATIRHPKAGTWTIFVEGSTVFGKDEKFQVRVD